MKSIHVTLSALVLGAALLAISGCGSSSSVTSPANPINNAPPAAPSNVHGTFDATTGVNYINWDPSSSASVQSYEVWQYAADPATGASGVVVGTAGAAASSYAVGQVTQNSNMYFRVRALDSAGNPSAFSASAPFTLQAVVSSQGGSGGGGSKLPTHQS